MNTFLEIRDKIFSEDNIVVISHVNPDGDAIGTGLPDHADAAAPYAGA